MFGAVCSGRLIQLAEQVEATKYVISVPNGQNVSHIAIFTLPQTEFTDPKFMALVYFQLPSSQEFKLLGALSPLKPSAIFKLNNNSRASSGGPQIDDIDMADAAPAASAESVINIGISIEPTEQAELLLDQAKQSQSANSQSLVPAATAAAAAAASQNLGTTVLSSNDIASLANKIVTHAYNFLGSFIDPSGKVPMKAFDSWWEKFKSKLANNPDFLNDLQ